MEIFHKILNSSLFGRHKELTYVSLRLQHMTEALFPRFSDQLSSSFPGSGNTGRKLKGKEVKRS